MGKRYLIIFSLCLSVAFGIGLAAGLMIAKGGNINYADNWNFNSSGFDMKRGKEIIGRIQEIKKSSLLIAMNTETETARVNKIVTKEIVINEQTQIWLKRAKTNEERYGVETMSKIADLEEKRKKESPREASGKYAELTAEISAIRYAATQALSAKADELSAQIEALKPEESERRNELQSALAALTASYTLTPIKLSDLQVGETATLSNEKEIDLNGEVVAERIVITR